MKYRRRLCNNLGNKYSTLFRTTTSYKIVLRPSKKKKKRSLSTNIPKRDKTPWLTPNGKSAKNLETEQRPTGSLLRQGELRRSLKIVRCRLEPVAWLFILVLHQHGSFIKPCIQINQRLAATMAAARLLSWYRIGPPGANARLFARENNDNRIRVRSSHREQTIKLPGPHKSADRSADKAVAGPGNHPVKTRASYDRPRWTRRPGVKELYLTVLTIRTVA